MSSPTTAFYLYIFDSYCDDKKWLEIIGNEKESSRVMAYIVRMVRDHQDLVRIVRTAFEGADVELIWGDTLNDELEVDLRLCLRYENKNCVLAYIEFKKNSKNASLVVEDGVKVLPEGKSIANKRVSTYNMNFEESRNIRGLTGQIVGLRDVLKELAIVAPGAYVAQSFRKTMKYPTKDDKLPNRAYSSYLHSRIMWFVKLTDWNLV